MLDRGAEYACDLVSWGKLCLNKGKEELCAGKRKCMNQPINVNLEQMSQWGRDITTSLKAGNPLLLQGPVGAGKSTLVRSILSVLRPHEDTFPSPSFPLMIPYDTPVGLVCHFDLYRLTDASQLMSLNIQEYCHQAICLIEWPEIMAGLQLPQYRTAHIRFHPSDPWMRQMWFCQTPCSVVHRVEAFG